MRQTLGVLGALLALIAVVAMPAQAQNGTLSGTVVSSDSGQPLAGAQVQILGGGGETGGVSGAGGQFRFEVEAGTYRVIVAFIGYRTHAEERVSVSSGQTTTLSVALVEDVLALNPIVVSVGRKPEKKTEAPATTYIVGSVEVGERPAVTPTDHLRSAPGVDIITSGVQSSNVVVRGFNNIFSGALNVLTDNRIAGVPSLRVNLLHWLPQTNDDIDRVEVVLGPGSALYGPNTSNGVLHLITKSPLDYQGTTVTAGGGEQGLFRASLWSSHKVSDDFAIKVSGQFLSGDEWPFVNRGEEEAAALAQGNPDAFLQLLADRGITGPVAQLARSRVGRRVNEFERYTIDARADWQVADDGRVVFGYGRTSGTGIELTGLGAAQTDDWIYEYFQARVTKGRFFWQAYLNTSDSGDTYLLNDGVPLVDESRLFVTQAQYGFSLADGREDVTFGVDYFRTNPRTSGTINGANEDIDDIDELGAYLQSETALTDQLDLVLAGRFDSHSFLEDDVFSPRAALVFKPDENSSFRITYNRAFSPPTTLNLFLDISGGAIPNQQLAALGYKLRAQGPNAGFSFMDSNGNLSGMRSPFTPGALGGPSQLLPVDVATLWQLGVGVLAAQGAIDPQTAALLGSLQPTAADIGINVLDLNTQNVVPLALADIPDVKKLNESTNETFEIGYQGIINNNFLLAADVWYSRREDFTSPLVSVTPLLMLNALPEAGPNIGAYLVPILMQTGMDQATAMATAGALAAGMGQIPLATVSSNQVNASGADVLATYLNAGTVKLWGADLAMKYFVDDRWTIAGSVSWVEDDFFADASTAADWGIEADLEDGISPIALNAPALKGSFSVGFRDVAAGFNAEARLRFSSEFPAMTAGFVGTECISGGRGGVLEQPCVDSATLVDVTLGYKVPNSPVTFQVSATNLFDSAYRSFVGVPEIGRFVMAQLKYAIR
jgi:outer membrane receptor for ferrienterochelin and colicins